MTTAEWIEQQLALAEKATPGPWRSYKDWIPNDPEPYGAWWSVDNLIDGMLPSAPPIHVCDTLREKNDPRNPTDPAILEANAAFIAAAREGYPKALRMLKARPTSEQVIAALSKAQRTYLDLPRYQQVGLIVHQADAVLALWDAAIEEAMKA